MEYKFFQIFKFFTFVWVFFFSREAHPQMNEIHLSTLLLLIAEEIIGRKIGKTDCPKVGAWSKEVAYHGINWSACLDAHLELPFSSRFGECKVWALKGPRYFMCQISYELTSNILRTKKYSIVLCNSSLFQHTGLIRPLKYTNGFIQPP